MTTLIFPIKVHLISKPGMYTVMAYNETELFISTKKEDFTAPISDFKCVAGGIANKLFSQNELSFFLGAMITAKQPEAVDTMPTSQCVLDARLLDHTFYGSHRQEYIEHMERAQREYEAQYNRSRQFDFRNDPSEMEKVFRESSKSWDLPF